jgi:drug/metabolite transporter (DMT)-like permease
MHKLSAFVINLTINLEPVYGILMAVLIFGGDEAMDLNFYLGTFIILLSVLAYPILRKWIEGRNIRQDIMR